MKKFHPDFVTAVELRHYSKHRGVGSDSNRSHEEHLEDVENRRIRTKKSVHRALRLKKLGY